MVFYYWSRCLLVHIPPNSFALRGRHCEFISARWETGGSPATSVSSSDAVLLYARVLGDPSSFVKKCCQQMVPEKIHRGVNVSFGKVQTTVG